ncbi:MAG: hypothetical protein U9Q90_09070 [Campylobacterota bacterium]|nr:hypothetical protein [Campylobacterota bacterium]
MDDLNKELFAFAAYNAGPNRIRSLRKVAQKRGLDPNVWFNNVEVLAAEKIDTETVTYVANIFKYYVACKLVEEKKKQKEVVKESLKSNSDKVKGTSIDSDNAGQVFIWVVPGNFCVRRTIRHGIQNHY